MDEKDKEKKTFPTPFGLFEFERMSFSLCNAPATFQKLMQRCLGEQQAESAMVYLDDVIGLPRSFTEHVQHGEVVFQSLGCYSLKLRTEKCQLFQKQMKFPGHVVSRKGVSPDPEKMAAVAEWQPPTTVRQVRSFLGFLGYFRQFMKDFVKIAKPLNELLRDTGRKKGWHCSPVKSTDS